MESPELCGCRPKGLPGKKQCVLSIDGGGVRGIMATVILESLESELQRLDGADVRIADYFDLIAGTSTGALVASLLVLPDPVTKRPRYTAKETTTFYLENAAKIFPPSSGLLSSATSWFTRLTGPKYSAAPLESLLNTFFGDLKLSETVKPVLIPSYDIKYQNSLLFSTTQAKSKQIPDCYIRDVCRSSSAAPTYLPPYYFSTNDDGVKMEFNMVDGAMAANNPAYLAVCELLKDQPDEIENQLKYENLLVLSLGTGQKTVGYDAKTTSKWGTFSWIYNNGNIPLFDILMTASQDIADYSMSNAFFEQCSENNYLRIQTDKLSDTQQQMDNATQSNLLSLVETTKGLLQSTAQTRNKLGQFVDDTRWTTYQAGIIQYAAWLVEERKARQSQVN